MWVGDARSRASAWWGRRCWRRVLGGDACAAGGAAGKVAHHLSSERHCALLEGAPSWSLLSSESRRGLWGGVARTARWPLRRNRRSGGGAGAAGSRRYLSDRSRAAFRRCCKAGGSGGPGGAPGGVDGRWTRRNMLTIRDFLSLSLVGRKLGREAGSERQRDDLHLEATSAREMEIPLTNSMFILRFSSFSSSSCLLRSLHCHVARSERSQVLSPHCMD